VNSRALAHLIVEAFEDKKGLDVIILDVRKQTDIADYFVIVHGSSDRHTRTLADHALEKVGEREIEPFHVEGMNHGKWILLDYGSVIAHVFYYETRQFYNLERLWGDGKQVKVKDANEKKAKRVH